MSNKHRVIILTNLVSSIIAGLFSAMFILFLKEEFGLIVASWVVLLLGIILAIFLAVYTYSMKFWKEE